MSNPPNPHRQPALRIVAMAALALLAGSASAQELTLEELLARHYQARGGLEKLRAIASLRVAGTLSAEGSELPLTLVRKRPSRYRIDLEADGHRLVQAYDGVSAWGIDALFGDGRPTELSPEEVKALRQQADFDGLLLSYASQRATLKLEGKFPGADGTELYRVVATLADGSTQTFLLGPDFLVRRLIATGFEQGVGPTDVEVDFLSYVAVDGVWMVASQTVSSSTGRVDFTFRDYELGVALDDELFLMPGQEARADLALPAILEQHLRVRVLSGSEKVRTLKATGKVVFQGFELPMTMYFERPRPFRVSIDMQGLEMIQAFDGTTAWTVSPMQGITTPEALGPEAEDAVTVFSDFLWGLLADHQSKGLVLELKGIERVGRDQTYLVEATLPSGKSRRVYLGGEDFLERRISLDTVFMGSPQSLDADLEDFREIDTMMVPHEITIAGANLKIQMKIDAVEVNADIDPAIFAMPPPVPEAGAQEVEN